MIIYDDIQYQSIVINNRYRFTRGSVCKIEGHPSVLKRGGRISMQKDDDGIEKTGLPTEELPEAKLSIILPSSGVAELLHKSLRWVYLHAAELGAARIGGSWIFTEEGLRDALQRARGMEIEQVRIEERGARGERPHKERAQNQEVDDRHGLAPFVRKKAYHPDH